MARSPEAEARYKAYQKKYHAERNARAKYSYEKLEKDYRVVVKGKNLSAEFMQSRAPGVTGETPWEKDLTVHPLKWRRYGMPKDLPNMVNDYEHDGKRVRRFFIDPRMLFDCSLFDNMTDEEIAYFNDEKHWSGDIPKNHDHVTLENELEGEPGVYGYLVHVNYGREEKNNPPRGRSRYKRKDGKELVWDDPRLDAPYWQECGDYMYPYFTEEEALHAFNVKKPSEYSQIYQKVYLYRLTKPINLGDVRVWLNSDRPLRKKEHGAIILDAAGIDAYGRLYVFDKSRRALLDVDELDEIEEQESWDRLTPEEQQKINDEYEYYEKLAEERRQINEERFKALDRLFKERFNVDGPVASLLKWAEEKAENRPDDESAGFWAEELREEIPNMSLDEKLDLLEEHVYPNDYLECEELLRSLNIVTPDETMSHLVEVMPLSQKTIEEVVAKHKYNLKRGYETKKLGFRRKAGEFHLNEEQEQYVRSDLQGYYARWGEKESAALFRCVYDNEWYRCLEPEQYKELNGFSWETINMEDYLAGRLLTFGDALPDGAFGPKHDRIEYLADLLKRGEIDMPTFWKRVEDSSYVSGMEQFGPDGDQSFIITKKNWRHAVDFWDTDYPEDYEWDSYDNISVFPKSLGGDSEEEYSKRLIWRTKDWEAWIDSLPDDWWAVNTASVWTAVHEFEQPALIPEMLAYHAEKVDQPYSSWR
ncbi:hypothetical protein [Rothia mucilaginosa]|uniref:hypothetical protein n=1 Tax=Rothia mucilaginosa TaxID=43675 RepID=UPI0028D346F6|nr:hypothetical protein [Rothia mucilaginosa]